MAERIDQLEDSLIEANLPGAIKLCLEIHNELVRYDLLHFRANRDTGEIVERRIMGHIGTLNEWKKQTEEWREELGEIPQSGLPGVLLRLLLCVLVPCLLWFLPPVRSFLASGYVVYFYAALVFVVPFVFVLLSAKSLGLWSLLAGVILFVALMKIGDLFQTVDGVVSCFLAVASATYVAIFLFKFHLLRDAKVFTPRYREYRALCRRARKRIAAIMRQVDLAIHSSDAELKVALFTMDGEKVSRIRETYRYVRKYYESLRSAF